MKKWIRFAVDWASTSTSTQIKFPKLNQMELFTLNFP